MFRSVSSRQLALAAAAVAGLSAFSSDRAFAATTTYDLFITAEQGAVVGGEVTTTSVYELGGMFSNTNRTATSLTKVENFTYSIGTGLGVEDFFAGDGAPGYVPPLVMDEGETGPVTASYLEAEAGAFDGGANEDQRIDFGRNNTVTFDLGPTGITEFIVAEIGAYNDFDLVLCADAACTSSEFIFNGVQRAIRNEMIATGDFNIVDDTASNIDQTMIFRFDETIFGFLKIVEADNRSVFLGARLQTDYVGGVRGPDTSVVPLPTGLPLMAGAIGLLALLRRRRS